ncbi:MAG: hypothetical protein JNJ71_05500 [Rubrivivax sp.]|nr:hypothetical protein [Rubrivivax sp.]
MADPDERHQSPDGTDPAAAQAPLQPPEGKLAMALLAASAQLQAQPLPPALEARVLAAMRSARRVQPEPGAAGGQGARIPDAAATQTAGLSLPQTPGALRGGPSAVVSARRRAWGWRPWAWSGGAALALVLLLSVAVTLLLPPAPGAYTDRGAAASGDLRAEALASGFMPLAGPEVWRAAPGQPMAAWLVATEMPRERLGLLGLPYDPARAGDSVRAELLMHGTGTVLAVRVVAQ